MTIKRLFHTAMMALQRGGTRRGAYIRKNHLMHAVGQNVSIQSRKLPLYPELISIHNNVHIASRVSFITHDVTHRMLNASANIEKKDFTERVGCIEIMDNVFIGTGATILYNVRIGPNVIVAAGSVVTKDVPANSVVGGVPARVIEPLDEYLKKLSQRGTYPKELAPRGQVVSHELEEYMWKTFAKERDAK